MYVGVIGERDTSMQKLLNNCDEVVNYGLQINEIQTESYKFLSAQEVPDWHLFTQMVEDFLRSNHDYLAFVKISSLSNPIKVLSILKKLSKLDLDPLDLFQLVYVTKFGKLLRPVFYSHNPLIDLGKVIGRNIVAYDVVYRNWTTFTRKIFLIQKQLSHVFYRVVPNSFFKKILTRLFISQQSIFSFNEKKLRLFFNVKSPFVYHSFERGTFAFIISRRFARALVSINTPPLLSLNDLLSRTARTQNIVSLRLLKSASKVK